MPVWPEIITWMRDPANKIPDTTDLATLELERARIAEAFDLRDQHPDISLALREFATIKRPFNTIQFETVVDNDAVSCEWVSIRKRVYWDRLAPFLVQQKNWKIEALGLLDDASEEILKRLQDPRIVGRRQGMVIGYVQSGKTANMAAVMAKAADCGYRLFIVLAGTLNNLRQQTQIRFEQELIGNVTGMVGSAPALQLKPNDPVPRWQTLTDVDLANEKHGDIEEAGGQVNFDPAYGPVIAVIKKNGARIKRLLKKLERIGGKDVWDVPVLIIDDESDAASVNTAQGAAKVNATNGAIRGLLGKFKKVTYVGYTATPYANLFIDYSTPKGREIYGEDLFPKDFVCLLRKPPGYFGAKDLFGIAVGEDSEDQYEPLPMFPKFVKDEDFDIESIRGAETIDDVPSLREAVDSFILSSAVRLFRGHVRADMSMLINPGALVGQHGAITRLIIKCLPELKQELDDSMPLTRYRARWNTTFLPGMKRIIAAMEERNTKDAGEFGYEMTGYEVPSFEELIPHIKTVVSRLEYRVVNSENVSELGYGSGEPKAMIVIGGNKLSRGLTLEGLSVSYFLRNPPTPCYDSLMQMGRWFGYRGGFIDVCRIWAAPEVIEGYSRIAYADEDLRDLIRRDYKHMKPKDLPPRVFRFDGMNIVAANKMGAAVRLSRSGLRLDRTRADFDVESIRHENRSWSEKLKRAGSFTKRSDGIFLFEKTFATRDILSIFDEPDRISPKNLDLRPLEELAKDDVRTRWIVGLAGRSLEKGAWRESTISIGGNSMSVAPVQRSVFRYVSTNDFGFKIVSTPRHFSILEREIENGTIDNYCDLQASIPRTSPNRGRMVGILLVYVVSGKRADLRPDSSDLSEKAIPEGLENLLVPTIKMPVTNALGGGDYYGLETPLALEDDDAGED